MLKEKIKRNENTIGMHINLCDITVGKIAGLAGYDFIWIDTEHSYLGFEDLLHQILAVKATGTPVIVRVPQDDLTATKKVLEMGPDGIIFPMVKSAGEANRLIATTLYPPHGTRGFGPMNAVDYGFKDAVEFTKTNHKDMCRFIQIEHIDAVNCLEELAENPFIDGFIIGPYDLSGSINELGNVFGENTTKLIEKTVKTLHEKGKYVGVSTGDCSDKVLAHWHNMGIQMLSAGTDYTFLVDATRKNCENLKKLHKI